MNLPNLLIVGAAKSGTTSLHNYLKQLHKWLFESAEQKVDTACKKMLCNQIMESYSFKLSQL